MSKIASELTKLSPTAKIELFVLDVTPLGGPIYHLYAGINKVMAPLVWQGQAYAPYPIEADGFEVSADGPAVRPTIRASNLYGALNAAVREFNRLQGAWVTRKRTRARFLDAVNFADGVNPDADPSAEYPDELWSINRITSRDRLTIGWELISPFDMEGFMLPGRQCRNTVCTWLYRSPECGYAGPAVARADDTLTANPAEDMCSLRVSGCQRRFGVGNELPIGIFPGVGLLREISP